MRIADWLSMPRRWRTFTCLINQTQDAATTAIEKGLEPLARFLFEQGGVIPDQEAAKFINEGVKDIKDALAGCADIIAEWVAEK